MGVSDDERRNVAETMRSMLIGNDIRYAEQFYDLLTGDVLPDYQTRSYQQTIEVLADLIDRPVCHPASVPFGPCGDTAAGCSVCGEPLMINAYTRPPSYYPRCAKCGAEVVR